MPVKIGVVIMAYGTPEKEEDVEPYLKDIFKQKGVPKLILQKTIERYIKKGMMGIGLTKKGKLAYYPILPVNLL